MAQARYYAVSSGNGNDGVSHLFPDYIVKTDHPYALARLAALTTFKHGKGQAWCEENLDVDGEAEYTIYATLMESPETQDERDEMQKRCDELRNEYDEAETAGATEGELEAMQDEITALEDEIEGFGCDTAWQCFEVFPWEQDDDFDARHGARPIYESLEECFGDDVALVKEEVE
jgi:hypothetical protein